MHYSVLIIFLMIVTNIVQELSFFLIYLIFFAKDMAFDVKRMRIPLGLYFVLLTAGTAASVGIVTYMSMVLLFVITNVMCTKRHSYNFFMILPAFLFYLLISVFPEYQLQMLTGGINEGIDGSELTAIGMIVDAVVFTFLIVTVYRSKKHDLNLCLSGKETGGFCIYFLFELFLIYVLNVFSRSLTGTAYLISGSLVFIFSLLMFIAYWQYLFIRRMDLSLVTHVKETEKYLSVQLQFWEQTKESHDEIRQLKHDLRSHLQIIEELCAKNHFDQAEKYTRQLSQKPVLAGLGYPAGNDIAGLILSVKKEIAAKQGTAFSCEGDFTALRGWESVDVCTLLSNLLDNAIEASAEVENSYVSISGIEHKNYFTLIIKNRTDHPVRIRHNQIATTKQDKRQHGIGLLAVARVVQKYQGEYLLSYESGEFSVEVILPIMR